jgi:hypothetical protein
MQPAQIASTRRKVGRTMQFITRTLRQTLLAIMLLMVPVGMNNALSGELAPVTQFDPGGVGGGIGGLRLNDLSGELAPVTQFDPGGVGGGIGGLGY